jgi:hypothetical protein
VGTGVLRPAAGAGRTCLAERSGSAGVRAGNRE